MEAARTSPSFSSLPTLDLGTLTSQGHFTIPSTHHGIGAQWMLKRDTKSRALRAWIRKGNQT